MLRLHRKIVAKKNLKQWLVVKKNTMSTVLMTVRKTINHVKMIVARFAVLLLPLRKLFLQKAILGTFPFFQPFKKVSFSTLILLFQTV